MHKPVLLNEAIDLLDIKKSDVVFDGTLGAGGHSSAICEKLGSGGVLIGVDQDRDAIRIAEKTLDSCTAKTFFIRGNFRNIGEILDAEGYANIDKIILDLGFSSLQLEKSGRGFSFQKDEPLLMTLKDNPSDEDLTAMEIVNKWGEESLADIIHGFGGERFARRIAKNIVEKRKEMAINTTESLVEIIKASVPVRYRNGRIHPATKTFQALRMAVNEEIQALKEVLDEGIDRLANRGRIAVISFHSLEDRLVKNTFKEKQRSGMIKILTKKPIIPSRREIEQNPRARSGKLRVAEKT